jgi:hypothetical protein
VAELSSALNDGIHVSCWRPLEITGCMRRSFIEEERVLGSVLEPIYVGL